MGAMKNAYYERGERVARALMYGQTLTVELDAGVFDLAGDELREVWDDLAPGEPFTILASTGDFPCCGGVR